MFTPLTDGVAQFGFVGRCADEKAPLGRDTLIGVIESLRDEGPTDMEMEAAVQYATRALGGSAAELAALDRAVGAELMGGEQVQPAELAERFAAVTPDSLREIYGNPDAGPQSIRYSDAVALIEQIRGLTVVARDASSLTVAPDFGDKALAALRAAVPADLYVRYLDDGHDDGHDHGHDHDHHHHHHH